MIDVFTAPEGFWAPSNKAQREGRFRALSRLAADKRNNLTASERLLWDEIKWGQLGYDAHCQHIVQYAFIVDFYVRQVRLIIEVDGGYHSVPEQQLLDKERERRLRADGYHIMRLTNEQVQADPKGCADKIRRRIKALNVVRRKSGLAVSAPSRLASYHHVVIDNNHHPLG